MKKLSRFLSLCAIVLLASCVDEKQIDEESITIGEEGTLEQIENVDENVEADVYQSEDGVTVVELAGNDLMQFSKNEIRVPAGQTVRLILKHVGELPEQVMGHNFVLLEQGTDVIDFAQQAATASGNEYIPEGTDKVIAKTEMIGGGEETIIEFEAPEAGTYEFICSFPGHYVQMRGNFIVE